MSADQNMNRRDFIKATTLFVALMGLTIGLPSIVYLLSPSLRKVEDESVVGLGPLENYPIGIPTLFEFTRTKVNGWGRTGLSLAYMYCGRPGRMSAYSQTSAPISPAGSTGILIENIASVPVIMDTSISQAITSAVPRRARWMNL